MARHSPERIEEIRGHLAELEHGDRTVAELARELGVAAWTVYGWKRRFGRSTRRAGGSGRRATPRAELIEVEPPPTGDLIEIVVGAMTVRVPRAFDSSELRRLLEVVRAC
jgi:transposase-like protein